MALIRQYLDFMEECITGALGELSAKKMLEFGSQRISDASIREKTGKDYFKNRGIDHTSVDLNGLNGAIRLDLTKPELFSGFRGSFDIVTNAGTSEHIEPKSSQYECFLIAHDCLKAGGIAIHLVPDINELENKGRWGGHCNNYYSEAFFRMLAEKNNYKVVALKIINGLICSCLQKQYDAPFMGNRDEFLGYISRKKGGVVYPGINGSWLMFFLGRLVYYIKHPLGIPKAIKKT